jgi:hypothetical protein
LCPTANQREDLEFPTPALTKESRKVASASGVKRISAYASPRFLSLNLLGTASDNVGLDMIARWVSITVLDMGELTDGLTGCDGVPGTTRVGSIRREGHSYMAPGGVWCIAEALSISEALSSVPSSSLPVGVKSGLFRQ